jgi:hypothetical protein
MQYGNKGRFVLLALAASLALGALPGARTVWASGDALHEDDAPRSRALDAAFSSSLSGERLAQVESAVPAHKVSELSSEQVRERTDFLIERLEARRKHATWWYRSWFTVYTGGLLWGTVRAATVDGEGKRAENIVTAVKSTVGLSNLLFREFDARHGADAVNALPNATDADARARLETAELQLAANAKRATRARSWKAHASSIALNTAGGAALLIVGSPERAAISTGMGLVFGEIAILTEPVTPKQDYAEYQQRYGTTDWSLMPIPGGLAFEMSF